MTDRERQQRILESQWHRMNNPMDENGTPLSAEQKALLNGQHSPEPGDVFLPEGTESFDRIAAMYEGKDFVTTTYAGKQGIWVTPPGGLLSAAWQRDGIFTTAPGVVAGDFEGDAITFRPAKKKRAESPKVKKYRNVMNGLIGRAGERHE